MNKPEPAIERLAEETTRDVEQGLTGVAPPKKHRHEHLKRTWGNKIFDMAVWPTIAFGAVYGLSTWAVKAAKDTGTRMNKIYEAMAESLSKVMPGSKAEMEKTLRNSSKAGENMSLILISFAVGTALMTPIKLLEDRRAKISKWIDDRLGTAPADPSHYAKEPKQTWGSVLGGRLVTFLSVLGLGTAIGGERTERITDKAADFVQKRWKALHPEATPQALERVAKWTKANTFEMFYTSLCAGMVYVLSRTFARALNKKEEHHHPHPHPHPQSASATAPADETAVKESSWQEKTAAREQPKKQEKQESFVKALDGSRSGLTGQPAL